MPVSEKVHMKLNQEMKSFIAGQQFWIRSADEWLRWLEHALLGVGDMHRGKPVYSYIPHVRAVSQSTNAPRRLYRVWFIIDEHMRGSCTGSLVQANGWPLFPDLVQPNIAP